MLTSENEIQKLKMRGAVSGNPFFQSLSKGNAASLRDNVTKTRIAHKHSLVPNSDADVNVLYSRAGLKSSAGGIKNSSVFLYK